MKHQIHGINFLNLQLLNLDISEENWNAYELACICKKPSEILTRTLGLFKKVDPTTSAFSLPLRKDIMKIISHKEQIPSPFEYLIIAKNAPLPKQHGKDKGIGIYSHRAFPVSLMLQCHYRQQDLTLVQRAPALYSVLQQNWYTMETLNLDVPLHMLVKADTYWLLRHNLESASHLLQWSYWHLSSPIQGTADHPWNSSSATGRLFVKAIAALISDVFPKVKFFGFFFSSRNVWERYY